MLPLMVLVLLCVATSAIGSGASLFPRSKPPAKLLFHVDLTSSGLDVRFAVTVLQGLVNRVEPRIYTSQDPGWHGSMNLQRWMDDLKLRGYAFESMSPEEAIRRFADCARGAVVYESDLSKNPESLNKLNTLTLYCALENCLPVTAELNDRLKLPVVLDVRGKFNEPAEAYEWAWRELWPRANRKLLAHTHPTHMVLRDYLVQHKVMPFWISKGMSAKADGIVQRFIREAAPNAAVMGCWGGYGEDPAGRYSEPELQRIVSMYGKFLTVTDGCFNLSVSSGIDYKRPERKRRPVPAFDKGKVYVTFHITDGDNLQWLQQGFVSPQWWLDPSRGKVPISWSLNPVAAELIPTFVEYVQSTATECDEFTCSTAGIGLVAPALHASDTPTARDKVYSEYLRMSSSAMERVGETCIHLGDTSLIPWTRSDFDRCAREMPAVKGILGDYGPTITVFPENSSYTVARGVVVLRTLSGVGPGKDDDERAKQIVDGIRATTPAERPGFLHVCLVNWFVTPTAIAKATDLLGSDYVAVLPSEIVELYRQAEALRR